MGILANPLQITRGDDTVPDQSNFEILLSNGTLMVHGGAHSDAAGNLVDGGASAFWYLLTPDSTGSYVNGTWSQLAPMNQARLYFSSDVLPNGDVFVFGGEYASDGQIVDGGDTKDSDSAEIFTPPTAANPLGTWTTVNSDPHMYPANTVSGQTTRMPLGGDQPSEVLPNGSVLVGNTFDNGTEIYTPSSMQTAPLAREIGRPERQRPIAEPSPNQKKAKRNPG